MGELPGSSGKAAIRAFEQLGWRQARQSGSHVILVKEGIAITLSVPLHKELDRGTLRSLTRSAGITVDEFAANLDA